MRGILKHRAKKKQKTQLDFQLIINYFRGNGCTVLPVFWDCYNDLCITNRLELIGLLISKRKQYAFRK